MYSLYDEIDLRVNSLAVNLCPAR